MRRSLPGAMISAVSFFDDIPESPELRPPEPQRQRWRGFPEDTHGAPVPLSAVLGKSDRAAVLLTDVVAYPAGMIINMIATSRLDPSPFSPGGMRPAGRRGPMHGVRLGILFSDGSKVANTSFLHHPGPPEGRILRPQGGSGGGRGFRWTFWSEPLPSPGSMRFVCDWIEAGIAETSAELDAGPVLEAAAKATPIWPDDVGLPEPSDRPRPPAPGFISSSLSGGAIAIAKEQGEPEPKGPAS